MSAQKTRSPAKNTPPSAAEAAGAQRRLEGQGMLALGMVFALAIVIMANYLSFRHYAHWDWTSQGIFTLSERSQAELAELDRDIELWLLMSSGEPAYQDIRDLLDRYAAASERIALHFVDPDRDPSEYRLVATRFGITEVRGTPEDTALVVASGEQISRVRYSDLAQVDYDPFSEDGDATVDVRSEQAITGAILEVVSERRTRVCVTEGHGEWSMSGGERDLSALRDEMRSDHIEVEPIETRGASSIPEDCDAVFVVGPQLAFDEDEVELLRRYLRGGGNALFALDAEIGREDMVLTGLEGLLRELGVRVDRTIVLELDARMLMPGNLSAAGPFAVADWGEHATTASIRQLGPVGMLVDMARSVRPADEESEVTVLVRTSESSFAETDVAGLVAGREPTRDDTDIEGPVPIAVAAQAEVERLAQGEGDDGDEGDEGDDAEEEELGGRVVVLGDADLFTGELLRSDRVVNYDFASAVVGWLTQRSALIELPSRRVSATPVRISVAALWDIGVKVILLLPLSVVFFGLAIWWNRRS